MFPDRTEPKPIVKGNDIAGAVFSAYENYRYLLWRVWNKRLPIMMLVGLHPSTADERLDDKTIIRGVAFARRDGSAVPQGMLGQALRLLVESQTPIGETIMRCPNCKEQWTTDRNLTVEFSSEALSLIVIDIDCHACEQSWRHLVSLSAFIEVEDEAADTLLPQG